MKAQRCFIDTEFTDFINCDLISIGAITEDGEHEFYVEISDYNKTWESAFVKEHIVPLLDGPQYAIPYLQAAAKFTAWVESLPFDKVFIAADYAVDWDWSNELMNDAGGRPANVHDSMLNIHGELQAATVQRCTKRDMHYQIEGLLVPEGLVPMGAALGEQKNVFNDTFMNHFYENFNVSPKYRQHHALYDARANRLGWMAAMKYIQTL